MILINNNNNNGIWRWSLKVFINLHCYGNLYYGFGAISPFPLVPVIKFKNHSFLSVSFTGLDFLFSLFQ